MKKKGQSIFGISFGALISIILIMMILVISVYAINHFLKLSRCSQVGMFYSDLEDEVIKAWPSSGSYRGEYVGELPSAGLLATGAEVVCFGNLTIGSTNYGNMQDKIKNEFYAPEENNVFIYPPGSACSGKLSYYHLTCEGSECLKVTDFFCSQIDEKGKVKIQIEKRPTDSQVTIKP